MLQLSWACLERGITRHIISIGFGGRDTAITENLLPFPVTIGNSDRLLRFIHVINHFQRYPAYCSYHM